MNEDELTLGHAASYPDDKTITGIIPDRPTAGLPNFQRIMDAKRLNEEIQRLNNEVTRLSDGWRTERDALVKEHREVVDGLNAELATQQTDNIQLNTLCLSYMRQIKSLKAEQEQEK